MSEFMRYEPKPARISKYTTRFTHGIKVLSSFLGEEEFAKLGPISGKMFGKRDNVVIYNWGSDEFFSRRGRRIIESTNQVPSTSLIYGPSGWFIPTEAPKVGEAPWKLAKVSEVINFVKNSSSAVKQLETRLQEIYDVTGNIGVTCLASEFAGSSSGVIDKKTVDMLFASMDHNNSNSTWLRYSRKSGGEYKTYDCKGQGNIHDGLYIAMADVLKKLNI